MNEYDFMNTEMNVHIDRLIIDGLELTPGQQRQLKTSLETSLSKLFTEQGISPAIASMNSLSRMPADAIKLTSPEIQPAHLGEQIANAVYQGLHKQV
jgi:hypothetical protein